MKNVFNELYMFAH